MDKQPTAEALRLIGRKLEQAGTGIRVTYETESGTPIALAASLDRETGTWIVTEPAVHGNPWLVDFVPELGQARVVILEPEMPKEYGMPSEDPGLAADLGSGDPVRAVRAIRFLLRSVVQTYPGHVPTIWRMTALA